MRLPPQPRASPRSYQFHASDHGPTHPHAHDLASASSGRYLASAPTVLQHHAANLPPRPLPSENVVVRDRDLRRRHSGLPSVPRIDPPSPPQDRSRCRHPRTPTPPRLLPTATSRHAHCPTRMHRRRHASQPARLEELSESTRQVRPRSPDPLLSGAASTTSAAVAPRTEDAARHAHPIRHPFSSP
jgi:hypothetical protein